jgi:hypothetical protein
MPSGKPRRHKLFKLSASKLSANRTWFERRTMTTQSRHVHRCETVKGVGTSMKPALPR